MREYAELGYRDLLKEAIKRTRHAGVWCAGAEAFASAFRAPMPTDITAVKSFCAEVPIPPEARISDCAGCHFGALIHASTRRWRQYPVLTIGNVNLDGQPRYNATPAYLLDLLKKGPSEGLIDLHVWWTFPDLTIADFTLIPGLESHGWVFDVPLAPGKTILEKPHVVDRLIRYRPFLVGEEFLLRIGAVMPEARQMLATARTC